MSDQEIRIPGLVHQIVKNSIGLRVWFMGAKDHELGGPQVRMCLPSFDAPIEVPGYLVINKDEDAVRFEANPATQN